MITAVIGYFFELDFVNLNYRLVLLLVPLLCHCDLILKHSSCVHLVLLIFSFDLL